MKTGNVMIGTISLKTGYHLTATDKKILQALTDAGIMQGGTKKIQFVLDKINSNEYGFKRYERYAKASREFTLRPEDKIVKWHYSSKGTFVVK